MPPPRKLLVETGQRIGRGVVVDPDVRIVGQSRSYRGARLLCDCGTGYETAISRLVGRHADSMSCGCYQRDVSREVMRERVQPRRAQAQVTHGMTRHPLFWAWTQMRARCANSSHKDWPRYGGRGIKVCDRWHDFARFVADIERELGPRPDGLTLDRIDNDGNYEPGNVRWATRAEQAANRHPRRVA